jgi:hypothetical protein
VELISDLVLLLLAFQKDGVSPEVLLEQVNLLYSHMCVLFVEALKHVVLYKQYNKTQSNATSQLFPDGIHLKRRHVSEIKISIIRSRYKS